MANSPVERPCEFRGGPTAAPPLREHVQGRKLEIDGQVDAAPEQRFNERISFLEVVEAVTGPYCVSWQKKDEDHRGEKCI
jgi:hypothetical protein